MSFANPYIFLVLIIPFILFAWLVLTNKDGVERVFSKKVLDRIRVNREGLSNRGRNALFLSSIFFMIIAMSHPYLNYGREKIKLGSLNIAMALDISDSMRAKDRYPNRLEFAKVKIKELLKEMPEDEFMLFTFSTNVYLVSPMTSDKDTLNSVVDGITSDYLLDSSNFTTLGQVLKETLKDKRDKIAIIISDGGESKDLTAFKNIIKKNGITLYAILVGTKDGSPVLDKNLKTILDKNDNIVITKVNEELGKIAKASGGDYIIAEYGNSDIKNLVNKIENKFQGINSGKTIEITDKTELFYYPLFLSAFLLLLSLISTPTAESFKFNFRKSKK